jgi:divalent metal cation (Fe/Co/Zn/Cd) transporter
MDRALDAGDLARIKAVLTDFREHEGIDFHALRTRQAGSRAFVSVHVLVPGAWTVQHGHDLVERVEDELRTGLPHATIFTHLEPVEDPKSFADTELDRSMSSGREPGL